MDMIRSYLQMGGYGAFVWPAFALSALVLAGMLIQSLLALKRSEAALAKAAPSSDIEEESRA